jgi:ABC-type transporter Mla subunit MlaD
LTRFHTQDDARPVAPSESALDPEHLLASIEPELKEVIDTAVARVAEVELTAVQQAQQLIARSEQEAREACGSALERSSELVSRLEILAAAVTDMSSALRAATDDVVESLRGVRQSLADLPTEADRPSRLRGFGAGSSL